MLVDSLSRVGSAILGLRSFTKMIPDRSYFRKLHALTAKQFDGHSGLSVEAPSTNSNSNAKLRIDAPTSMRYQLQCWEALRS